MHQAPSSSPAPEIIAPRPLSRLTYKIMSLNLLAVFVLVVGIGYLDRYREGLTNAEMETLSIETQLYAAILAESSMTGKKLQHDLAANVVESFVDQKNQQIHVFDTEGRIVIDSKTSDLNVKTPRLPRAKLPSMAGRVLENSFAALVDAFAVRFNLPLYPSVNLADSSSFPDVADALAGDGSLSAWQKDGGGLILSSAAPIKKDNHIVGVVLVTRSDTTIETTFANMRLDILKLFLVALTSTIAISLYLSGVIGHPLRQLASAAEAIRAGNSQNVKIPDMSGRNDEIGELSIALREMTDTMNERLDTIDRFAADVAHELKNPLTSMRSAIETLEKIKSDADRKRLTDIILHDLNRMNRLITDISQASRLDTELSRDILTPVDLRNVLLPLIDVHRQPIDREGSVTSSTNNISFTGLAAPVMVMGLPVRLAQVFQNLIGNALSFSPPGSAVRLKVEPGSDYVQITVDDDGPGIPDTKLEKIFERFYSERPAGEAFGSHSGLGLSIVKQIIDAHGATVHAENRYDPDGRKLGARFIVRLKTPKI